MEPPQPPKALFSCECGKELTRKSDLKRHKATSCPLNETPDEKFVCPICNKEIARKDAAKRHMETHNRAPRAQPRPTITGKFTCKFCPASFPNVHPLKRHVQRTHKFHPCDQCTKKFTSISALSDHKTAMHQPMVGPPLDRSTPVPGPSHQPNAHFAKTVRLGSPQPGPSNRLDDSFGPLQPGPSTPESQPPSPFMDLDLSWENYVLADIINEPQPAGSDTIPYVSTLPDPDPLTFQNDLVDEQDPDVLKLYKDQWRSIRTQYHRDPVANVFNLRLNSPDMTEITRLFELLHESFRGTYKINFDLGLVVKHKTTQEVRYWYPEKNSRALDIPYQIASNADFIKFKQDVLASFDPLQHANCNR